MWNPVLEWSNSRVAKTWNNLPVLNSNTKASTKNILHKYYIYKQRLVDSFDTDNTCTWTLTCQCGRYGNV